MGTVVATPAADEAILRLPVVHRRSPFGDRTAAAAATSASSLTEAELPSRINDIQLGEIGGCPFPIDADITGLRVAPTLSVDVPHGVH